MTLIDFANIFIIVQGVAVTISLFFIGYQLRQSTKLARAANAQSLAQQSASFNALLIQDRGIAALWYSYGKDPEILKGFDRFRYQELLVQWLIVHENIYYQYEQGLLDCEIYEAWLQDLRRTLRDHNLDMISGTITEIFPGKFGEHLAELQKTIKPSW